MAAKKVKPPFQDPVKAKLASKLGHIARYGLPASRLPSASSDRSASQMQGLERESRIVRADLAALVRHCIGLVLLSPPRRKADLGNTPDGEGVASVIARLTDTASTLFGWNDDKGNSVVLIGLVSSMDPEAAPALDAPALDVEEVPQIAK